MVVDMTLCSLDLGKCSLNADLMTQRVGKVHV